MRALLSGEVVGAVGRATQDVADRFQPSGVRFCRQSVRFSTEFPLSRATIGAHERVRLFPAWRDDDPILSSPNFCPCLIPLLDSASHFRGSPMLRYPSLTFGSCAGIVNGLFLGCYGRGIRQHCGQPVYPLRRSDLRPGLGLALRLDFAPERAAEHQPEHSASQ